MMHAEKAAGRRLYPRIFDTDWLMLRGMTQALNRLASKHVSEGQTVLDFGCGDMPYRSLIEARGGTYIAADFGEDADVRISQSGLIDVPDQSVDVVLSVQVLEHVRDLGTYFGEILSVLKPGGVLLLSTHGTWLYHPHPEDHRRWTRMGLINDIEANAFGVQEIEAIVGPLGTTTMIRSTGYAYFLRRLPVIGGLLAGIVALVMNARGWLEEKLTPEQIRFDNGCVYMTRCAKLPA
jgi:SAM-dependent methyltransferase